MSEALRVFTRESAGADVSLVFYAGHGLEMDGVNYLVLTLKRKQGKPMGLILSRAASHPSPGKPR